MEFAKAELKVVEQAHDQVSEFSIQDLSDLELAFVGGGHGDVHVG
jgi:hypothetical protein